MYRQMIDKINKFDKIIASKGKTLCLNNDRKRTYTSRKMREKEGLDGRPGGGGGGHPRHI